MHFQIRRQKRADTESQDGVGVSPAKLHESDALTGVLSNVLDKDASQMRISKFVDEFHVGIISLSVPPMAGDG